MEDGQSPSAETGTLPSPGTRPPAVMRRDISIMTQDAIALAGTLFTRHPDRAGAHAPDTAAPAVLVSAAAAVERRFYRSFAEHLVEHGARMVLTYDYRGIGVSARSKQARSFRMKQWGTLDFPAALAALEAEAGPGPIVTVGHSFGGIALGLSGASNRIERAVMVASLNGWYRRTAEPLSVLLRMNLAGVPLARLTGHIPRAIGFGTELAGPIFVDWARWCRHRDFLFADPSVPEAKRFADVRLPLLSIGLDDDPWGTPAAVGALLQRFGNAELSHLFLSAKQAGRRVGHTGFFRREMRETLWPVAVDFVMGGILPANAQSGASSGGLPDAA